MISSHTASVTFPITFTETPFGVYLTDWSESGGQFGNAPTVNSRSKTGFTARIGDATTDEGAFWMAIGK